MIFQTSRLFTASLAHKVGFFSAIFNTMGGIIYFFAILTSILTGHFNFPPGEGLQLFGGIISLIFCPVIVSMMAGLHTITPTPKKVLSQISLGFSLLFALAVSINRFSQIGVVRQAVMAGKVEGISWFIAYGDYSIFLGLEYLGWAWFLGLAMLFAAPLFSGSRLNLWICWLMLLYAALGLLSSVGFLLGNWLSILGFVAWGIVLFVITGLLAVFFYHPTLEK
ncbi:MAG: hypothetical protein CVU39_25415 [Chloroflexi bacterium HGW-Chloroflexi-10]|nr:MAG: hypothetical protein CVU39_25415 [Chloroflexi bacterium HGW-Chloroflexi-10]